MDELTRYADAFGVDQGRQGCWRYIFADHGHGRPGRCPGEVQWAGTYETQAGHRRRVWSCDDHLDGGRAWLERPARAAVQRAPGEHAGSR